MYKDRMADSVGFVKTVRMSGSFLDDGDIKSVSSSHQVQGLPARPMSHTVLPVTPPPIPKRLVKTALHQAVLDGRLHQVRLLVERHGVNVDVKDVYGRTPLMLASMVDEDSGSKMAKICVNAGSSISLKDNMGRTALSMACLNGREKIVDEILRKDILNINDPDNDGNTPLHHAAASGNPNIVKLLSDLFVKFGLDIDTRNMLGYTALLVACRNGHFVSAHHLLTDGRASPALRDGETFLNANEWTHKSSRYPPLPSKRIASSPGGATAFMRESSMYTRPLTPVCKHTRQMLPTWSKSCTEEIELSRSETFLDGKDARQMVLNEISVAESHGWSTKKNKSTKIVHPPTAKLLALSRRRTKSASPPDMNTIFRMYSDQYQPDWRRLERKSLTLQSTKKDKNPAVVQVPQRASVVQVTG